MNHHPISRQRFRQETLEQKYHQLYASSRGEQENPIELGEPEDGSSGGEQAHPIELQEEPEGGGAKEPRLPSPKRTSTKKSFKISAEDGKVYVVYQLFSAWNKWQMVPRENIHSSWNPNDNVLKVKIEKDCQKLLTTYLNLTADADKNVDWCPSVEVEEPTPLTSTIVLAGSEVKVGTLDFGVDKEIGLYAFFEAKQENNDTPSTQIEKLEEAG